MCISRYLEPEVLLPATRAIQSKRADANPLQVFCTTIFGNAAL